MGAQSRGREVAEEGKQAREERREEERRDPKVPLQVGYGDMGPSTQGSKVFTVSLQQPKRP